MKKLAPIALVLAVAGCTPTAEMQASQSARAERELADALKDHTPGEPQSCISSTAVQGPQVIDSRTILYRQVGGIVYRSTLDADCPALDPLDTIVIELHGTQICRNDLFRVLEAGSSIPSAACRMGNFVPYRKNKG